ncbi:MAG: hypothetical protein GX649_14160 [Chloroflexi bacterium]|nr:hypothetical protein [Chloroflexota bacterium]
MAEDTILNRIILGEDDKELLARISRSLPLLADVCRADLLVYGKAKDGRALTVAQAKPHSVSPLYEDNRIGIHVGAQGHEAIVRALHGGRGTGGVHTVEMRGATIARQVYPIWNARGRVIAVLAVDSYWLAYERHRRRSAAFQNALREFIRMVLRGELDCSERLSPFGEHDGLIFVGADERVEYMSGIALSLYRRLGFRDSLVGVPVDQLDPVDHALYQQTIGRRLCIERQDQEFALTWVRKALPVNTVQPAGLPVFRRVLGRGQRPMPRPYGVFILIHDATEALEAQRELESKTAMIREVHHRVKNNLQVIASLMRMQARRVTTEEARVVLEESVNRILSVAVVHEFLSQNAQGTINLLEIANRIISQVQQGLVDPSRRVRLEVKGPAIWLVAERATQCALVINELVQNAIEHGFAGVDEGRVVVEFVDDGERVSIRVIDNGTGLPEGFDLDTDAHLGLRIVRSMVERDLRGQFELRSADGTHAVVQFDKSMVGGN